MLNEIMVFIYLHDIDDMKYFNIIEFESKSQQITMKITFLITIYYFQISLEYK